MNYQPEADQELNDAPLLRQMSRKSPYTTPDGYFDMLSSEIQDKLQASKPRATPKILVLRPAFLITSLIIMVISLGIYFKTTEKSQQPTQLSEIVTYDDLLESGYYSEIDETLLSESLATTTPSDKSDKQMEDYLLNNSDENQLLNELPL
ncbi:hypothetical protein BH11BAC2_BH11BAC2_16340 [soil metagenome]